MNAHATIECSSHFGALINETCEQVGVPPASVWLDSTPRGCQIASFKVEEIECTLSHRSITVDRLFLHCKFGPLPDARCSDAMLALLQLNLIMYGGNSPAFAVDPERNVLLCMEMKLEGLDAATLVQTLESLVMQAMGWRKVWLQNDF